MLTSPKPDITPAWVAAILQWIVSQAVAYGWLSSQHSQVAVSVGSTALGVALMFADAHLRGKRNEAAKVLQPLANVTPTVLQPPPPSGTTPSP